jgi:DNA replication and repair protein RecF
VGLNGMGKTNILDAIYYTCIGKSYFSSSDKVVIQHDQEFFRLEANVFDGNKVEKIVIKAPSTLRKTIEISGTPLVKLSDHIGRFLCVIVSPSDIHALLDTSEERRNYINQTISQLDRKYLEDIILYNQLLKRRNAVLKTFLEQKSYDPQYLESISHGLYAPAKRIHETRKKMLQEMSDLFFGIYQKLSGNAEQCKFIYQSDLFDRDMEAIMELNKEKDRFTGRTNGGIHKDDIRFEMNNQHIKNFGSQGQIKSYVLSLKLTQYQFLYQITDKKPILLLDDLFDKLDQERVKYLLTILVQEPYGQVVISDTSLDRILNAMKHVTDNYSTFVAENGVLTTIDE